jgi:hypothetical protein
VTGCRNGILKTLPATGRGVDLIRLPTMSEQELKIATWNLDRPNRSTELKNKRILDALKKIGADIWILTETNSCICPGEEYIPFSLLL